MSIADYLVSLAQRIERIDEPMTKEECIYHVHKLRNFAMICLNEICQTENSEVESKQ